MQQPIKQASIYTDFGGLNSLRVQARTDRESALEQVARQFESLFLGEMLKSMRDVNKVFAEGNYLSSNESEFYQDMFDSQLTLSMTAQRGFGLAEALVAQLSRQIPGMDTAGRPTVGHRASIQDYDRGLPVLSPRLPEQVAEVDRLLRDSVQDKEAVESAGMPERFDSPADFVETLMPLARRVGDENGIDPRLMIAQAALETGWGRHMIEGADGQPSFNLFGIKADHRWQGESVNIATTEFRGGVAMSERANFRAYEDYEASFRDYVSFLQDNPRYRDALAVADNPELFAEHLQAAGYATDPDYAAKIRRIMNGQQLAGAAEPTLAAGPVGKE
ncbi:MAG: flagellar assembly peptidoglycan hydrolase FlgJ [Marinobacter sp.]|nr:flagellar assembly peptidoglycan hydrolase FlgJ [Marinobacter sp.]